jgi:hypothetical protein
MAPLSGNRIATANVATYQLVATPGPLDHFNGLAIREAPVACWAAVWRGDQGLVGVPVRAVEEI